MKDDWGIDHGPSRRPGLKTPGYTEEATLKGAEIQGGRWTYPVGELCGAHWFGVDAMRIKPNEAPDQIVFSAAGMIGLNGLDRATVG